MLFFGEFITFFRGYIPSSLFFSGRGGFEPLLIGLSRIRHIDEFVSASARLRVETLVIEALSDILLGSRFKINFSLAWDSCYFFSVGVSSQ